MLRGVAALLVVFYHVTGNAKEILHINFLFNFFSFGFAGVDIFFVLSGFIITYTSVKNIHLIKNIKNFFHRRFVRIFPNYWIITTIFLLIQILLPAFYKTHYTFSLINLLNTYLLLPGHVMVNGVSWTLTFELFFYIVFSLAFLIPDKKTVFFAVTIYAVVITLLPLCGYNYTNNNSWINVVTSPMIIEFFLGLLCAIFISHIPKNLSKVLIISGTLFFIMNGMLLNAGYRLMLNDFNRVIFFGVPALFIIAGVLKYEFYNKISTPSILLHLGDASYSLYLLHLPIIVACCKIIFLLKITNVIWVHIIFLAVIIVVCYASILYYNIIEKPIISVLNNIRKVKMAGEI